MWTSSVVTHLWNVDIFCIESFIILVLSWKELADVMISICNSKHHCILDTHVRILLKVFEMNAFSLLKLLFGALWNAAFQCLFFSYLSLYNLWLQFLIVSLQTKSRYHFLITIKSYILCVEELENTHSFMQWDLISNHWQTNMLYKLRCHLLFLCK